MLVIEKVPKRNDGNKARGYKWNDFRKKIENVRQFNSNGFHI